MNAKTLIIQNLREHGISEERLGVWSEVLGNVDTESLGNILEVILNNPKQIEYIANGLEKKIIAIQNNDDSLWDQILAEDSSFIKSK